MSYIGQQPSNRILTSADLADAAVTTPKLANQAVDFNKLATGTVLQVVNSSTSVNTSNNTSTYADTGLSATITPKFATSKILVIVNQNGVGKGVGDTAINIKLFRNSTDIATPAAVIGYTGSTAYNICGTISFEYLDSPATTSSTTYKTQFNSWQNRNEAQVQWFSSISTITLMEIAG